VINHGLVPNGDDENETDLVIDGTQEICVEGLAPLECVVYGVGLLRTYLMECVRAMEVTLGLDQDAEVPVQYFKDMLESLEVDLYPKSS
jgi:hypothetical protein